MNEGIPDSYLVSMQRGHILISIVFVSQSYHGFTNKLTDTLSQNTPKG